MAAPAALNQATTKRLVWLFMMNETEGTTLQSLIEAHGKQSLLDMVKQMPREKLLPHLFQIRGKPYSLHDYPQCASFYPRRYPRDMVWLCGRQIAKCIQLTSDAQIWGANGRLLDFAELRVGTSVLGVDARLRATSGRIIDFRRTGQKSVFRVRTRLGADVNMTQEHRLRTLFGYTPLEELSVGSRIAALRRGGCFTGTACPSRKRIILTAYMISDGYCRGPSGSFTAKNSAVLNEIADLSEKGKDYSVSNPESTPAICWKKPCPIRGWLKEDGLWGTYSYEKYIPKWVFRLSREDTVLFLSRLWATDGMVKLHAGHPDISYTSTSRRLASGVRSLLVKLGITASMKQRAAAYNGKRCHDAFITRVEGRDNQARFLTEIQVPGKPAIACPEGIERSNRDTLPFEINTLLRRLYGPHAFNRRGVSLRDRKLRITAKYPLSRHKLEAYLAYAEELKFNTTDPDLEFLQDLHDGDVIWDKIESIEPAGKVETFDIEVESIHNFIIDGIVSHNSTNLSRSEVYDMVTVPHTQILYVAPLQSQAQRYSQLYLHEAISTCGPATILQAKDEALATSGNFHAPIIRAVGHQTFANGSGIQLTYAKTSADRARGITADRLDFDEIQDQQVDHLAIISESITQSERPQRRFTGTAKTTDNIIEHLWRTSSKGEWAMRCGCGHWNIPNRDGGILDMITAGGPVCVKCGRGLPIREGSWVHEHPDRCDEFIGHHIPQIIVPAIVNNPNKWALFIDKITKLPPSLIYTELLGISSDEGVRLITQQDIDNASNLGTHAALANQLNKYAYIVIGVDWGIAEITSFTVATAVGITPQGTIEVLYAKRYVGMDMEVVLRDIQAMAVRYKASYIAADFGVGFTNNQLLSHRTGKVVQIQYVRQNKFLSYQELQRVPRWTCDRNTALTLLFWNIKQGNIRFPNKLESENYTADLLSPYEHLIERESGIKRKTFLRDPSRPDDFAHALTFAMLVLYQATNHNALALVPEGMFDTESTFTPEASPDVDMILSSNLGI